MVKTSEPDWHLRAWMNARGKKQGHLVTELGWHKTTAHRVWHGRQPYRRDLLNQVAIWLDVEPYELLMPPARAASIRRWFEAAQSMVAEEGADFHHDRASNDQVVLPGPRRGALS